MIPFGTKKKTLSPDKIMSPVMTSDIEAAKKLTTRCERWMILDELKEGKFKLCNLANLIT